MVALAAQEENNKKAAAETADSLVVEGYKFNSQADAAAAREEVKKQRYLEEHLDFDKPEEVLVIYDKIIANKIFVTPLGFFFMKKLQQFLTSSPDIANDRIQPLPLGTVYTQKAKNEAAAAERPRPVRVPDTKPLRQKYVISVLINVLLAIVIAVLFFIAMDSDNPNILNYKQVIQNQYSTWDDSLTKREKSVREKEKELGMRDIPSAAATEESTVSE